MLSLPAPTRGPHRAGPKPSDYCDFPSTKKARPYPRPLLVLAFVGNVTFLSHVFVGLFDSYTKPKGQLPDYTSPVVLPDDHTAVEDFCLKIHKSLIKEFK